MTKLFLVALCSLPLLAVARAEEGQMKADNMQHGHVKQGDSMGQERAKTAQESKKSKKKDAVTMGHDESMGGPAKREGEAA
jgi:hypothetical protein